MGEVAFDVFLSHCSAERDATTPLLLALEARGLRVFRDDRQIPPGAPDLPDALRSALAASKLLVAWATPAWWSRSACRWELTAAACVAAAERGPLMQRVHMVVPPSPGDAIARAALPPFFRLRRVEAADELAARVDEIAARLAEIGAPMSRVAHAGRSRWVGPPATRYPRFVGREADLWETHGALMDAEAAALTGAPANVTESAHLHGLGGNGKSLLATEYALRFAHAWPGGVVWIDAARPTATPEQAQRAVLAELGTESEPPTSLEPEARAGWIRGQLARALGDAPLLWVVDDPPVRSASGARLPLDAWRCPLAHGRTLLTTRAATESGFTRIAVGVLETSAALTLLRREATWDAADTEDARAVVEDLGGHPLAIDVAGALLARHGWRPSTLRSKLAALGPLGAIDEALRPDGEESALRTQLPRGHEPSVLRTLTLSWDSIGRGSQLALRACASLADADVPAVLLEAALAAAGVEVEAAAIAQVVDAGLAVRVEGRLRAEDPPCSALRVHGLVREMARRLWGEPAVSKAAEAGMEAGMLRAISAVAREPWRHGEVRPMMEHAEVIGAQQAGGVGMLAALLGVAWKAAGELDRARLVETRRLEACERVLGREHRDTLNALQNLAVTLHAQGDLTGARRHLERAQEAMIRLLGPEHHDTLSTLHSLAGILHSQGDLPGAKRLHERTHEAMTRRLGSDHPETLSALQSLAGTLHALGDLPNARHHYETALDGMIRGFGAEHPDTLTTLQNLAGTLLALGDVAGARRNLEHALETRTLLLGHEHPDTLATLQNLALILKAEGDLAGARRLQEQALEGKTNRLGADHPQTLGTLHNLAMTLQDQGDSHGARQFQERVLEARTRLLGSAHPDTLATLRNLALTLKAQGDLSGARRLEIRALAAQVRFLGFNHPDTLSTLQNLANTFADQGHLASARSLEEWLLTARTRLHGAEHPDTLTALQNLAATLNAQGDPSSARRLHERALESRTRVLGPDHPETLATLQNLALTLKAEGDLAGARRLEERALEARIRLLGPEHPHTLATQHNLAVTLHMQGDLAGARGLYETGLEVMSRRLGPEHRDTTATRYNLVLALRELEPSAIAPHLAVLSRLRDRPDESLSAIERAIKMQLAVLVRSMPHPASAPE